MKGKIRNCILCGNSYKFCPRCSKDEPSWKKLYDKASCKALYELILLYKEEAITLDEAQNRFSALDISGIDTSNIKPAFQSYLDEIKKKKRAKSKKNVDVAVEEIIEESSDNDESVELESDEALLDEE